MLRHRSSFGLLYELERVAQALDNTLASDVVLFHAVRAHDEVDIGIAVLANSVID